MSVKKRILLACEIFPPDIGGPATYANDFLLWLKGIRMREIVNATALTFGEHRHAGDGVMLVPRSGGAASRTIRYFLALFRAARTADAIYAMGPLVSGFCAIIAGVLLNKRVIIRVPGDRAWETAVMRGSNESFEDFQTHWHTGLVRVMEHMQIWALKRASSVIAQSQMWERVLAGWGVPAGRIHVIHNSYTNALIAEQGNFDSLTGVLAIGRLVPWKKFDDLIEAFESVCLNIPDSRLMIVGLGPEERRLKELAGSLACRDRIEFHSAPHKGLIGEWWARAAVFVLPSGYEGSSNSILEAWSAGVPVIASDIEGNTELIRNGENGLLFKYGDREGLSHALVTLLKDSSLRRKLAEHARKELSRFHQDKIFQEVYTVLTYGSDKISQNN